MQAADCAALADPAEVEAPLVDLLLKVYKPWFRPLALHQQKTKLREHTIRPRIFCVRLAKNAAQEVQAIPSAGGPGAGIGRARMIAAKQPFKFDKIQTTSNRHCSNGQDQAGGFAGVQGEVLNRAGVLPGRSGRRSVRHSPDPNAQSSMLEKLGDPYCNAMAQKASGARYPNSAPVSVLSMSFGPGRRASRWGRNLSMYNQTD